jgi:GT2 family glycosyltransferase
MKISVIIPTYKRIDKLQDCLDSMLQQTFPKDDYEILVVEDGSHSGAEDLVKKLQKDFPNIHYFWRTNAGPAAARNVAIKSAQGEVCAFTDDDCTVPPDWLEKLWDGFQKHPEVTGVGGRMEPPEDLVKKNGYARFELYLTRVVFNLPPERQEFIAGKDSPIGATNNIAYKTSALRAVGGFDEKFLPHISGEERDLKERLCAAGYDKLLYIPTKVTHHRTYDGKSFFRQSYERGLGTKSYAREHGLKTNYFGLIRSLIFGFLALPYRLLTQPDRELTLLKFLNQFFAVFAQTFPVELR